MKKRRLMGSIYKDKRKGAQRRPYRVTYRGRHVCYYATRSEAEAKLELLRAEEASRIAH